MDEQPRIKLDKDRVKRDEVVEVRTLMPLRLKAPQGAAPGAPSVRIRPTKLICKAAGKDVFSADLGASVTPSAYFSFKFKARESGLVEVIWTVDGRSEKASEPIIVV